MGVDKIKFNPREVSITLGGGVIGYAEVKGVYKF